MSHHSGGGAAAGVGVADPGSEVIVIEVSGNGVAGGEPDRGGVADGLTSGKTH